MPKRSPALRSPLAALTLAFTASCTGAIGTEADEAAGGGPVEMNGSPARPGRPAGMGGTTNTGPVTRDDVGADRCAKIPKAEKQRPVGAAMRRLSWVEIHHALGDLFPGVTPSEFDSLAEPARVPERTGLALAVNESFVRAYHPGLATFAKRAADSVVAKECTDGKLACLDGALLRTAQRAWRSNLGVEKEFLSGKLASFHAAQTPATAFANTLRLVLGSPRFLYLLDPGSLASDGAKAGVFEPTGDRVAGQLAAALWASVPDAELLAASAAGRLRTPDGLALEVERMLSDARAKRGMTTFFRGWLQHNLVMKAVKDEKAFPGFDDALRNELREDTEKTLLALVFDEKATPDALLTSPLGFPGPKTVSALGWTAKKIPAERGSLASVGRSGVATHPSVLAVTSKAHATSIVNRGRFFVEKLACAHIPDPPPDVDADLDKIEEKAGRQLSARELAEFHAKDPGCASCHKYLDPFGMVFEGFDPIGRQRTEDEGMRINAGIKLDGVFGLSGEFSGPGDLLRALATKGDTERCYATSFAGFVLPAEWNEAQTCAVTDLLPPRGADGGKQPMREIAKRFVMSDLFLKRSTFAQ